MTPPDMGESAHELAGSLAGGVKGTRPTTPGARSDTSDVPRFAPLLAFGFTGDRRSMAFVSNDTLAMVVGRTVALYRLSDETGNHTHQRVRLSKPPPSVAEVLEITLGKWSNKLLALENTSNGNQQIAIMDCMTLERFATIVLKADTPVTCTCPSIDGSVVVATTGDNDDEKDGGLCAWWGESNWRVNGCTDIKGLGWPLKVTANPYDKYEYVLHGKRFVKKLTLDVDKATWREIPLSGVKHVSRKDMIIVEHEWLRTDSETPTVAIATERDGVLILTKETVERVVSVPGEDPVYCIAALNDGLFVGCGRGNLHFYRQTVALPSGKSKGHTHRQPEVQHEHAGIFPTRPDEVEPIVTVAISPDENVAAVYTKDEAIFQFSVGRMLSNLEADVAKTAEKLTEEEEAVKKTIEAGTGHNFGSQLGLHGMSSLYTLLLPGFARSKLLAMSCSQSRPLLATAHQSIVYMSKEEWEANQDQDHQHVRGDGESAVIRIFDWMKYSLQNELYVLDLPTTLILHPNGWYMYVAFSYKISVFLLGSNLKPVLKDDWHIRRCRMMALPPSGHNMIALAVEKTVLVVDTNTGKIITTLHGHQGRVAALSWSLTGVHIVSSDDQGTIYTWNIEGNFRRSEEFVRKNGMCCDLAFSVDRRHCVYADPSAGIGWFSTLDGDAKSRAEMTAKWAASLQEAEANGRNGKGDEKQLTQARQGGVYHTNEFCEYEASEEGDRPTFLLMLEGIQGIVYGVDGGRVCFAALPFLGDPHKSRREIFAFPQNTRAVQACSYANGKVVFCANDKGCVIAYANVNKGETIESVELELQDSVDIEAHHLLVDATEVLLTEHKIHELNEEVNRSRRDAAVKLEIETQKHYEALHQTTEHYKHMSVQSSRLLEKYQNQIADMQRKHDAVVGDNEELHEKKIHEIEAHWEKRLLKEIDRSTKAERLVDKQQSKFGVEIIREKRDRVDEVSRVMKDADDKVLEAELSRQETEKEAEENAKYEAEILAQEMEDNDTQIRLTEDHKHEALHKEHVRYHDMIGQYQYYKSIVKGLQKRTEDANKAESAALSEIGELKAALAAAEEERTRLVETITARENTIVDKDTKLHAAIKQNNETATWCHVQKHRIEELDSKTEPLQKQTKSQKATIQGMQEELVQMREEHSEMLKRTKLTETRMKQAEAECARIRQSITDEKRKTDNVRRMVHAALESAPVHGYRKALIDLARASEFVSAAGPEKTGKDLANALPDSCIPLVDEKQEVTELTRQRDLLENLSHTVKKSAIKKYDQVEKKSQRLMANNLHILEDYNELLKEKTELTRSLKTAQRELAEARRQAARPPRPGETLPENDDDTHEAYVRANGGLSGTSMAPRMTPDGLRRGLAESELSQPPPPTAVRSESSLHGHGLDSPFMPTRVQRARTPSGFQRSPAIPSRSPTPDDMRKVLPVLKSHVHDRGLYSELRDNYKRIQHRRQRIEEIRGGDGGRFLTPPKSPSPSSLNF